MSSSIFYKYEGTSQAGSHKPNTAGAQAAHQTAIFEACIKFTRTEGIITAPEACHDIKVAIDEAIKCRESGEAKTILIAHSGHGHFDLASYAKYLSGELIDYSYPEEDVYKAMQDFPKISS